MLKQQHQLFTSLLAILDAMVITLACYAAWFFRLDTLHQSRPLWPDHWESYIRNPLFLFAVPITLGCMWFAGLYKPRRDKSLWNEYGAIFQASLFAIVALVVVLWLVGNDVISDGGPAGPAFLQGRPLDPGRVQILALAVMLPLALSMHRTVFRFTLRQLRRRGKNLRHVAIVGIGKLGQIACATIERNAWTGLNVAYFISAGEKANKQQCLGHPIKGGLADLESTLEQYPVDAIYLALPNARASKLPDLLRRLDKFSLDVRVIPDVLPRYLPRSMTVDQLDGMPVLSYRESPTQGMGGMTKRIVDLVGASVAIVLFAPVMLACAIAVRCSSAGPIIFKQQRVSIAGEIFNIYKFRTMYCADLEAREALEKVQSNTPGWTSRNDPRITPIGRFLRRTSLDELPQLFNVLQGHMSLVGPRPERPELIEKFREDWRGYMIRQHVKAGMTGWAQVNGLRGDTSLRRRLRYDIHYIRNWSLGFDLKILWLTIFQGFTHKNAH